MEYKIGIPFLYRYLAPIYPTLRPFWTGTLTHSAEQYLEQVALPVALHPRAKVLDLGCGPGSNLARLRQLSLPFDRYVGLDLSPAMLAECRSTFPTAEDFVLGDTHWLPFVDGSFDVILSTWMFSHLPQPSLVVRQAERLLRPGGWLIIVCFAKPAGLPGAILRLVEPAFLMHSPPLEEIQTWHGLIETKTFLGGLNVTARLQKQISITHQH